MAAEVGLLAHSKGGVAYSYATKWTKREVALAFDSARLLLDPLFPVKATPSAFDFRLGPIALKVAP